MSNIRACTIIPTERGQRLGADRPSNAAPADGKLQAPDGKLQAPDGALDLALEKKWMWKPGETLRIRFTGGSSFVRKKVQQYAVVWTKYANIKMRFVDSGNSDIRIAFKSGDGSWSVVGNMCRRIDQRKPTMNFGWFDDKTSDAEFSRTVVHEFGHALGCIHEHQSPGGKIPWNKAAVYKFYGRTQGWTKDEIDFNIFQTYSKNMTQFSRFDKQSIMLYPIPKELTTNGFQVGSNTALSTTDKEFIGRAYPFNKRWGGDEDSSSDNDSDRRTKKKKKSKWGNKKWNGDSDDVDSDNSKSLGSSYGDSDSDEDRRRKKKKGKGKKIRDDSDDDASDNSMSIGSNQSDSDEDRKRKKKKKSKRRGDDSDDEIDSGSVSNSFGDSDSDSDRKRKKKGKGKKRRGKYSENDSDDDSD